MNRPRPAPAATSMWKCAPRYTRDRQTAAASAQGRTFHQPFEVGGHQRGDREDHHGMTGGTAQPVGRGLAAQDHIRQGFRWPVTLHDHLGHRLQPDLQQGRGRQPQPPQQRGRGRHQGKSPDHSRQLDRPHRRIQPPRPVIDPAEHGHIRAQDRPVRDQHPAHDQHAEPGGGHRRVGSSALVRPAVRGLGPPQGQPPAQRPRPASPAHGGRGSRPSGCTCRHRCHTCRLTPPLSSRWPDRSAAGPRSRGRRRRRRSRTAW
jgi:hypothetical protein